MSSIILGLLAETFIHPGTGQSVGAVDLPVAREAATDYPFVAGSSVKGALKDRAERNPTDRGGLHDSQRNDIFGRQENAGQLLVSDARLLLLPVRSLQGAYKWLTCPHLLERASRDLQRAGRKTVLTAPSVNQGQAIFNGKGRLMLEERGFVHVGKPDQNLIDALKAFLGPAPTNNAETGPRARLAQQLVILNDEDFAWFARYGLAVQAHNQLSDNKTSENLWFEENLPPDTLMYTLLTERSGGAVQTMISSFKCNPYLQLGGDETTGKGWFSVTEVQ